jgi:HEAT repeat protein
MGQNDKSSGIQANDMKHLSDETFQLIQQLYQPPSLVDKFLGRQEKPSLLLERIKKSGEQLAIPNLLSYAVTNRNENGISATKTIHTLLNRLSIIDLASLDEHVRQLSPYCPHFWGWSNIQPDKIAAIGFFQPYQVSILGVSSFHNNGFVREKAIHELGNIWSGKELPFLLIRLNDWVSNVRDAASTAVAARLQPNYAFFFIDCLPLIMQIGKRNRVIQSSVITSIQKLLQAETSRPSLYHGFRSQDRFVRRACFQIAFDAKTISPLEIIELGIKDSDNLIRLWCVQKVRALSEDAKVDLLLKAFGIDPYMNIRREALRTYVAKFPERASEELRKFLLDSHRSMREEARYWLTKIDPMDFASFYRKSLSQGNKDLSSISGLEETGNASDGPLIETYVTHPLVRIRRVATEALAKLNPKGYTELFMRVLLDPSVRVSREATKALEQNGHLIDPQRLWDILENTNQNHIKSNLLSLFAHLPKWESIFYLIKAALSADEFISKMAYQKIDNWRSHFNSSFTNPTSLQKENLLKLLAESNEHLETHLHREIEGILKMR